jgi:hypothetical protein
MKNSSLIISCLAFLFSMPLLAQKKKSTKETILKKNYVEAGFNLTGAIQTFVRNRTDSIYTDPYALSLKIINDKMAYRFGLGYSFRTSEDITLIQARVNNLNRFDIRAGIERQLVLGEHWRIYAGADILWGLVDGKNQFAEGNPNGEIITVKVNEHLLGGGPILGIQYHLNSRISFLTEASLYGMRINTEKIYSTNLKPDPIGIERSSRNVFPPGMPRSIVVVVRF